MEKKDKNIKKLEKIFDEWCYGTGSDRELGKTKLIQLFTKVIAEKDKKINKKDKEIETLAHNYSCVLDHATLGNMSKTNYDLKTVYAIIDDKQQEHHWEVIKTDINEIVKDKTATQGFREVMEYVNNL